MSFWRHYEIISFLDVKRNWKIGLSPLGRIYTVCTLLTNARFCLHNSISLNYFKEGLPFIDKYFVWKNDLAILWNVQKSTVKISSTSIC